MKAVMYHYVREFRNDLEHFRFLDIANFERQLDFFEKNYGFLDRQSFERALETGEHVDGVVLTFDDGFADHFDFVFPALRKRGLWGLFFVSTGPYDSGQLLNVHRVHMLLGKIGGRSALAILDEMIDDDTLDPQHVSKFESVTYGNQNNDDATTTFKRKLNYYITDTERERILSTMMEEFFPNERTLVQDFYLSPQQIAQMSNDGMIIGSHTINHPVLSKFPVDQQRYEIEGAIKFLSTIVGKKPDTFCYPYGGSHSYNQETIELLQEAGVRLAFSVESRDIMSDDLCNQHFALPRFNCNEFPHGQAS